MVVLSNCEESESDKAIEYSEEWNGLNFPPSPPYFTLYSPPYFPPSPPSSMAVPPSPYFPLYSPPSPLRPSSSNSSVTYVWDGILIFLPQNELGEDIVDLTDFQLALLVEYKIQDRGGALDVIPSGRLVKINELVQRLDDIVDSEAKEEALEYVDEDYRNIEDGTPFEPLEKQNEDIVDQLVTDLVHVVQHLIQYGDGALDETLVAGVTRVNGSEFSYGQLLTSTPEPGLIFQTKLSLRVWQGHRGQWVVDICCGWNWLNTGTLKTAEGSLFWSESVLRFRGGKDLFDYPFSELFVNENRAEPTTTPRTEIQMLEFPPTEEQENPDEDFELWCSEATGNDGVEAEATRNDGFEAVEIPSCNSCDSTPMQEVIQSTLKYACREYGIHIWPPHTNTTPMLVDQEEVPQALTAIVDTNSVLVEETPAPLILPTARQENQDKDLGNDEVEVAGIMGEGTKEGEIAEVQLNSGPFGKRKRKEKAPGGERGNKKATRVRNVIPLEEILQVKEMLLKDAAKHLKVSRYALKRACRKHGINRWPPRNEHRTSAIVDQEGIPEPSENSCNDEVETVGMGGVGTGEGEVKEGELNCGSSDKGERNEKTPQVERANNGTAGVRIEIPLEEILKYKKMCRKDAATHLQVSISTLKRVCRGYGIYRWPPRDEHKLIGQSRPNESPAIEDQERNPQKNSTTLQRDLLTYDPGVRLENPDENSCNDEVEAVGMGGVGTGEGEVKEGKLDCGSSDKGERNEKIPQGERANNKGKGVRTEIPLEEILKCKDMCRKDAAACLKVSESTLKRICRGYNISRWSPRELNKLIGQSHPNESPLDVDQEQIHQLNCDTELRSNQASIETNSVNVKAKYEAFTIKFRLSRPWQKVELEKNVKMRLPLEVGTYHTEYKDENGELILISCDDDLKDCIPNSSPMGTCSIELFLRQSSS